MIPKKNDYTIGSLLQFSPYIVFITLYSSLYAYALHANTMYSSTSQIIAGLPLFAAFVATIYACFTFKDSLKIHEKIELFLSGASHIAAMHYYMTLICIAIFNNLIAKTNGVLTVVTLALLAIPTSIIMPCVFLIASILSIIIPSLPATILLLMPITNGIAQSLDINSAYMAATVVGGALYGSHMSLYLENFTVSQPDTIKSIFKKNIWFIITAACITLCILSQYECITLNKNVLHYLQNSLQLHSYITIIPYLFIMIASMMYIDVIVSLTVASCIAVTTQIIVHQYMFLDAIATMFSGFYKSNMIVSMVLFHILIAGLIKIIKYNSGFHYFIDKTKPKGNKSYWYVQASIIFIAILTTLLVLIDTLCLNLIAHPLRRIADKYNISQDKVTSWLHITTTTMLALIPYAPIMFITIEIAHSSYFEIMSYMIYPFFLTLTTIVSIFVV